MLLSLDSTILLEQRKLLSPDTSMRELIAMLVVRALRLSLSRYIMLYKIDRDTIQTVVRGSGSNQDSWKPTLTQPSAESQETLIRRFYAQAELGFEDTRYVEAHGK
ncbi:hypothetical protein BTUL_0379g00050 [Botrytis tulipae]|uniref:Beta-ketoacyl synthase C-terminal domain-containing protein n=1 Tax=Botrytis tulipae TaxID=87230 RepID=A0A4Z1E4C6_9HELO|nr:hypothetical protein BTUL_0379g00050 [Botrytis tulipae]